MCVASARHLCPADSCACPCERPQEQRALGLFFLMSNFDLKYRLELVKIPLFHCNFSVMYTTWMQVCSDDPDCRPAPDGVSVPIGALHFDAHQLAGGCAFDVSASFCSAQQIPCTFKDVSSLRVLLTVCTESLLEGINPLVSKAFPEGDPCFVKIP